MKLLWLWLAISMFVSPLLPGVAAADSSVVVLGVRSLDGEDEQARQISNALRQAARKVEGFQVSDRDVSLAQMSLAHGCDEPDSRCMADIASTLKVDRLIYGTVAHSGALLQVSLFSFDSVSGRVEASVDQKIVAERLEGSALPSTAEQLMARLSGRGGVGALRILGDVPGAEVSVDGTSAGQLSPRGELLLSDVQSGKRMITLRDPMHNRARDVPVMVGENATATLRIVLTPPAAEPEPLFAGEATMAEETPQDSGRLRKIVGYSAVGVAVGLAAATIYSWVRIGNINDDSALREYRTNFGPEVSNVCARAEDGYLAGTMPGKAGLEHSTRNLCNEADTLEVLQYVFLGSAIAVGGVGTYLLLTKPEKANKVSVRPSYRHGQAMVRASFQF